MKKHFLRVLTVMLMVCLGIGVLAACGDNEEPETPPADPIEGVWTGSDASLTGGDAPTLIVDVEGDTANAIFGVTVRNYYEYLTFTKASDGSYTRDAGEGRVVYIKVNAENKLEYGATGEPAIVFPDKVALPDPLNITGTKYTTYNGTEATITFGATPAITYDGDPLDNVKAIDVGGFKVFTGEVTGYATVTAIIYKDGNINKAYITLSGDFPGQGETCILSDTAPTPETADPMDGVWTGTGTSATVTVEHMKNILTATVKIVGNKAYAVIMDQYTEYENTENERHYTYYRVKVLNKEGDIYTLTDSLGNYTGTLNAQNQLVVTMPGSMFGGSENSITVTFTDKADLPAAIAPSGTLYPNQAGNPLEINFTDKELKQGTQSVPNAQFVNVGNYIVISVSVPNMGSMDFIVYENDGTYYWVAGTSTAELVGTKPTPAPATYAVEFSLGQNSENHSTGDYTLPTRAEDKAVGDKIDLPATDPTPASGWKFDGWYTENNQPAKGTDGKYTVAAADDENADGTITLTAKWSKAFTVEYTLGSDSHAEGQYTPPTVTGKKVVGDKIELPTEDPTPAEGYDFVGWYTENDQPAKGTDGKYTVAEADDKNEDGTITLTAKFNARPAASLTLQETVTAGGDGQWNQIKYVYPTWLRVGEVVTITGNLTMVKDLAAANNSDGVLVAVSEDTNLRTESAFCMPRYDRFMLGAAFNYGYPKVDPVTDAPGDAYAALRAILRATDKTFKATVGFYSENLVVVEYEFAGTVQLGEESAATKHTWSMTYWFSKANQTEKMSAITVGLGGENASLSNITIARTTHTHSFADGKRCECGVYNPDATESVSVTTLGSNAQTFTATVKNVHILNTDTDGAWPDAQGQGGGTGCTTEIKATGDFAVLITFDKTRDTNYSDALFDLRIGTNYLTYDFVNDNFMASTLDDAGTTETKTTGTKPATGDNTGNQWAGTVKCLAVRVGTTLYIKISHFAREQGTEDWTREYTITSFSQEDVFVRMGGNEYWNDNFAAFLGTAQLQAAD